MKIPSAAHIWSIQLILALLLLSQCNVDGFRPHLSSLSRYRASIQQYGWRLQHCRSSRLPAISISTAANDDAAFELERLTPLPSEPVRLGPHVRLGGTVLNLWGLAYAVTTLVTAVLLFPFMFVLSKLSDISGNGKRRRVVDWVIWLWARTVMTLTTSRVRVYGKQHLPARDETVVYVPNHTSFFDIPLLSGYVPRAFKYLSKAEITSIPVVGAGMRLAKHVFIRRNDPASTLLVADTCVRRLRDGNSMLLFPEGRRSDDGRLHRFKKGAFQIAKEAGVRVVPLSVSNMHRWSPGSAVLPIAPIRFSYVKIHPPVSTEGRSVREIQQLCFEAVNEGLPPHQQYVKPESSQPDSSET